MFSVYDIGSRIFKEKPLEIGVPENVGLDFSASIYGSVNGYNSMSLVI